VKTLQRSAEKGFGAEWEGCVSTFRSAQAASLLFDPHVKAEVPLRAAMKKLRIVILGFGTS
jgi:hypothetical protein